MKRALNKSLKNFYGIGVACAIALMTSSCESFFDSEGNCDPQNYIKFEYTMHMEYGDAFKEQVKAVNLWIFDNTTGELADHIYTTTEELKATDYLLPIYVKPGEYNFVAWCGDIDNRHFRHNDNISHLTHTSASLFKRGKENEQDSPNLGMATSDENLDLFFHGKLNNAVVPSWEDLHTTDAKNYNFQWDELNKQYKVIHTVPLVRDVNNITLTIQHKSGAMNTDFKRVTMIDNNGSMNYDNSIDESDEHIVFKPWAISVGRLDGESTGSDYDSETRAGVGDPSAQHDFMKVELSTGRLMADHDPKISITDIETGNTMISFPVVNWLLQLRSANYANMGDQEYLDRKNDHELYVILDDDGRGGWTAVSIVINGWHVIDDGDVIL